MRSYRWLIIIGGLILIAYFSGALGAGYDWMQDRFREFTGSDVWQEDQVLVEE